MSGDLQRRLAEALRELPLTPALPFGERGEAARLLAPLVDDLCRERAATELREAAEEFGLRFGWGGGYGKQLRARAAALDPEETP